MWHLRTAADPLDTSQRVSARCWRLIMEHVLEEELGPTSGAAEQRFQKRAAQSGSPHPRPRAPHALCPAASEPRPSEMRDSFLCWRAHTAWLPPLRPLIRRASAVLYSPTLRRRVICARSDGSHGKISAFPSLWETCGSASSAQLRGLRVSGRFCTLPRPDYFTHNGHDTEPPPTSRHRRRVVGQICAKTPPKQNRTTAGDATGWTVVCSARPSWNLRPFPE